MAINPTRPPGTGASQRMVDICSNHAMAFAAYSVADGSANVYRPYDRLRWPDAAVHASSEFMASLAQAFRRAFLVETERLTVPEAVDQAVTVTRHDLLDGRSAALRTQVLPTFYLAGSRPSCVLDGPDRDYVFASARSRPVRSLHRPGCARTTAGIDGRGRSPGPRNGLALPCPIVGVIFG